MGALKNIVAIASFLLLSSATLASAEAPLSEGGSVVVNAPVGSGDYPTLTRGRVVFVNAQRLVVTQEPPPMTVRTEAPPEAQVVELEENRPAAPSVNAIWVAGHWAVGQAGLSWVSGRYVNPRPGYAFVPPRWAVFEEQHMFFNGFFVPHGVFVRSHFNRFFFSGTPERTTQRVDRGPYWPVGAPTRGGAPLTSARARDPYWPVGAPTRANSPFNRTTVRSQFRPVGLPR